MGVFTPVAVGVAAVLAILINETTKLRELFPIAYFLPVVTSMAAVALHWKWMYHPAFGLINAGLELLRIPGVNWLADERTALATPSGPK